MDTLAAIVPFGLDLWIVSLLIGVAFGFVLEAAGFGDSRRLAAQFYFTDIRVVRVMFTAIVTCMLLLLWSSALGILDFQRIYVNPTFLGPGILGGFLLGFGFIIGGYCPGTSLTSAATGKIDGIFFVLGVAGGSFVFSETADSFRLFYDTAGAMGRVTLPEFFGIPAGYVAILVVFMAVGMFLFMGALERGFGRRLTGEAVTAKDTPSLWGPLVKGGSVAIAVFLLLAFALPAVGQPSVATRAERMAPELDPILESRAVHADPVEVLGLMHNQIQGKRARVRLLLIDLRSESDYNLFHLEDAKRFTLAELEGSVGKELAGREYANAIKVLIANDEATAEQGWRMLQAQGAKGAYVLAGGVNLWLRVFKDGVIDAERALPPEADGRLRHTFPAALGERHACALPAFPVYQRILDRDERSFTFRVVPLVVAATPSGGCG